MSIAAWLSRLEAVGRWPFRPLSLLTSVWFSSAIHCSKNQPYTAKLMQLGAALLSMTFLQAALMSAQVSGGFSGSRPAAFMISLLKNRIGLEEFHGTELYLPLMV